MERRPVASSLIRSVAFDPASSILEVEFTEEGSGHVYAFHDVPFSVYEELLEAESKGRYFNDFIREQYASERVS